MSKETTSIKAKLSLKKITIKSFETKLLEDIKGGCGNRRTRRGNCGGTRSNNYCDNDGDAFFATNGTGCNQ